MTDSACMTFSEVMLALLRVCFDGLERVIGHRVHASRSTDLCLYSRRVDLSEAGTHLINMLVIYVSF